MAAMKAPTLLVFGDADSVRPALAAQFFELLGGGQRDAGWDGAGMPNARLAILPGVTHYNIFASPALAPTARRSSMRPCREPSEAAQGATSISRTPVRHIGGT
ncbi:MAG: hypothetical protein ACLQVL_19535 [Terriglobia bacterium]